MIACLAGNSAKPSQHPGEPRSPLRGRRGRRRRVHVDAIRLLVLDDNYRGGRFCPIRTAGLSSWRIRRTPLSAGKRNSELPITVTGLQSRTPGKFPGQGVNFLAIAPFPERS